jgi:hypothetical protein
MTNPFLPDFSHIDTLWAQLSNPDLSGTAIEHLLKNDPKVWGLDVLDSRVGSLLSSKLDITDAGGSFFKKQQTWREMDKGISEVSVLSAWNDASLLLGTAYPNHISQKTTAPFDAHLTVCGLHFGGDIKTATTAASGVILERFEPRLEVWTKAKLVTVPEIQLQINGSLDLRRLDPKWSEILRQFETGLQNLKNDELTIHLNCPLPGDANDPADAGDLEIRVTLLPAGSCPTHSWTQPGLYQDNAKNVRIPSVEFATSLIEKHAREKGRHEDDKGAKVPFILAYHRRGKPGDLSPESVANAMTSAAGPAHWLGAVYIDELTYPASKAFYAHQSASFPAGITSGDLKRELER